MDFLTNKNGGFGTIYEVLGLIFIPVILNTKNYNSSSKAKRVLCAVI